MITAQHRSGQSRLLLSALLLFTSHSFADRLHLLDGKILDGDVAYVTKNALSWRLPGSTTGMNVAFKRVSYLEMDPSKEWEEALVTMEGGQYEEAAKLFSAMAKDQGKKSAYPAPGNQASRARYYLVECYRRSGDAKGLERSLPNLQPQLLAPWERNIDPALTAWGELQKREPEKVLALLPEDKETDPSLRIGAERHYLRGAALKRLGRNEEAIAELTQAYSFSYTDGAETISARALQEAGELLARIPGRRDELRAILHLYASRHGDGALWPTADPALAKLLFEPLQTIIPGSELEAPATGAADKGEPVELVGRTSDSGELLFTDDFKAGVDGRHAGTVEGASASFEVVGEAFTFQANGQDSYQLNASDVESTALFEEGVTYRLLVEVRSVVEGGGYNISFRSGEIFGTTEAGKAPAANVPWKEVTLNWTVPTGHDTVGQPVGFRISGDGTPVRFRSLRLLKAE